jgi:hypothetical protein
MVATVKTWFNDINNEFSSAYFADQYQEAIFAILQTFLSAGWTVTLSCDSVSVDASNLILTRANIIWGNGAQVRSWFVVQSPAGWCSTPIYALIGAFNSNASSSPTVISVQAATSAYTGGSTTAFPTAPTGAQTSTPNTILSYAEPALGAWSAWWTADGDVWFGTKNRGNSGFTNFLVFRSDGGFADGGRGAVRAMFKLTVSATSALTYSLFLASWQGWRSDGTAMTGTGTLLHTIATALPTGNAREAAESTTPGSPIFLGRSASGADARYLGVMLDVLMLPRGTPATFFGEVRDNEGADQKRYVNLNTLMLPTNSADLQINEYGYLF